MGGVILKLKIFSILPIMSTVIALVLNFTNFIMGWSATPYNFFTTMGYWLTWVLLIILFIKDQKMIKFYSIFWMVTTLSAFIAILYNINIVPIWLDAFIYPFILLLMPQWYGIEFIVQHTATTVFIIFFISLGMYITTVFSYKKIKTFLNPSRTNGGVDPLKD